MSAVDPTETAVARAGFAFADALVRGDWSAAHAMLAPRLQKDWQPADLKRQFDSMTRYWDRPATLVERGPVDSERAYVAIYSVAQQYGTVQEAVDVRVVHEGDNWLIDDIVWGRP